MKGIFVGFSTNGFAHYNAGRPHSSLGPGIPDRGAIHGVQPDPYGEFQPMKVPVISRPILGGLHYEYAGRRRQRSRNQ